MSFYGKWYKKCYRYPNLFNDLKNLKTEYFKYKEEIRTEGSRGTTNNSK